MSTIGAICQSSPCVPCGTCQQSPCCCSPVPCCPEFQSYDFQNANLAGTGVLGTPVVGTEVFFRGIGTGDDIVATNYNSTTKVIEIYLRRDKLLMQQVWNDANIRQNSVPDFRGQLGVTRTDNSVWVASGVLIGQWTPVKTQQTFLDATARAAATPLYLGQLAIQLSNGALYRGSGASAGNWTLIP